MPAVHTIFDIGLYDGTDTAYYLSLGSRVIAVEANPQLVARGQKLLSSEIASGRLTIVHAAISTNTAPVELTLSADDIRQARCSTTESRIDNRRFLHRAGLPILDLMKQYGVPDYLSGHRRLTGSASAPGARFAPALPLLRDRPGCGGFLEHIRSIGHTLQDHQPGCSARACERNQSA